jgi:hypothetical protein
MDNFGPLGSPGEQATIQLSVAGTWRGGMFSTRTPASPGYDPETQRVFIGSQDRRAIDVLDISNPYNPKKIFQVDLRPFGGKPTSIDVHKGLLAVTVGSANGSANPNKAVFFNADGDLAADPIELPGASKAVFTPDGQMLVVTIGGSPSEDYSVDPEGSIAIIDLHKANWRETGKGPEYSIFTPEVRIADFRAFNDRKDELIAAGVRIYGPNNPTVAQDIDPTGALAITADSRFAWVTLQVNNALAVVDLNEGKVIDILPLGSKDHSLPANGFDASDKDDAINIQSWPVRSFYMPNGIAVTNDGNQTLLVTVNEGDPKDPPAYPYTEKVRVKDLQLDPDHFPDAASLQQDKNLGRLQVTNANGDIDGDGDFDELYLPGGRSFSIWTTDGNVVFDSGDDFERIIAQAAPKIFNAGEDSNVPDVRSDDRGPEPEHVVLGNVASHQYAFISFEHVGGVIAYDVTDPEAPKFVQYTNNRNIDVDPSEVCGQKGQPELPGCKTAGDLEPEGLLFIAKEDSPIDAPLLVVNHELSDSTTLYRIDQVSHDSLLLAGLIAVGMLVFAILLFRQLRTRSGLLRKR